MDRQRRAEIDGDGERLTATEMERQTDIERTQPLRKRQKET